MSVKISVIVPVYNVEKTLERCIESILNQSFKEFEIILVDDGSLDNSGKLCDEYAEKYNFISVIHKENEGLGPTRNAGVKAAKGKYIYHCDSDDWIEPELLEKAFLNAEENSSEVVVFGYTMFTEENDILTKYGEITVPDGLYESPKAVREFFTKEFYNSFVVQSACNRLINRQFLVDNDIWFKPFRRCQDIVFSVDLFEKVSRLSTMSKCFYDYIIVPGTYKSETVPIYMDVFDIVASAFTKWGVYDGDLKKQLVILYISRIANLFSYDLIHRSDNQNRDIQELLNDKRVQNLFSSIAIKDISSRYIKAVVFCYTHKLRLLLKKVLISHQKKVEK